MNINESNLNKISKYLQGHIVTKLTTSAVSIGLLDLLKKTPLDESQIANNLEIEITILKRYLRAIEGLELIALNSEKLYTLTELGMLLCQEGSAYGYAKLINDYYYNAWQELEYSLTTGKSALHYSHNASLWEILEHFPDAGTAFSKAMRTNSSRIASQLFKMYIFPTNGTVADLGAGDGTLLAEILKNHPKLSGIAVEQKSMINNLEITLSENKLTHRSKAICMDLLNSTKLQANIFILKSVLHNWDDVHALKILQNCAKNLRKSDKLLILESAMNQNHPNKLGTAILDLSMLVLFGSSDRDITQYRKLIEQAGLRITKEFTTESGMLGIETVINSRQRGQ